MDYISILKRLSTYAAVSGYEKDMAEQMKELFGEYCDDVGIDKFYNVVAIKRGTGNGKYRIMITAHLDEIGFLVKSIDENGFLRLANIGGIDSKILLAQEVTVHGRDKIPGFIGAKPPHLLKPEETKKAVKMDDLYVDVGMNAEYVKNIISIGDLITFKSEMNELQGGKLSGKTVDNRCGIAVLLGVMEELTKVLHEIDVYFVATVQEETHCTGAETVSFNLEPDIAVIIDACHGDMPDAPKDETYPLGKGPAIAIGPNLHRKFTKKLMEICKEENIPFQIDVEPDDTGTEAWITQVSRAGIPSLLVSIPVRYMHTTVETVDVQDIKNAARAVAAFVKRLEPGREGIQCLSI
ncbi:MAG: M20/M25/M40 family metallo-hydrolase [Clostridia bacterium]|nr:M20/M25/M40 family metallo-hydrolase [Clostridia bacterium]